MSDDKLADNQTCEVVEIARLHLAQPQFTPEARQRLEKAVSVGDMNYIERCVRPLECVDSD